MQVATHEATLNQQWEFNIILLTSIVLLLFHNSIH